jgi:hypothetical protein
MIAAARRANGARRFGLALFDQAASATAKGIAAAIKRRRWSTAAIVSSRLSRRAISVLARIG